MIEMNDTPIFDPLGKCSNPEQQPKVEPAKKGNIITRAIRAATAWAWRHEITICEGVVKLTEIHMTEQSAELAFKQDPLLAKHIATCFAHLVWNAPNYVECQFNLPASYKGKFEHLYVLIRKGEGKTPHQMREAADYEKILAQQELGMVKANCEKKLQEMNQVLVEHHKANEELRDRIAELTEVK